MQNRNKVIENLKQKYKCINRFVTKKVTVIANICKSIRNARILPI